MNIPAANTCEAVRVCLASVLARERTGRSVFVSGFARRRGPTHLCSSEHRTFRVPQHGSRTLWTLKIERLKALSLLRFFVALDKEMTRRHAQWLIVIKNSASTKRATTWRAPTRH